MRLLSLLFLNVLLFLSCTSPEEKEQQVMQRALSICKANLLLDSHIDWPFMQLIHPQDISINSESGDFNYPKAKLGGLDAVMSVAYIDAELGISEGRKIVDSLITIVSNYSNQFPVKFAGATTPSDIRENFKKGLISLPLCLENGAPIGNDLEYVQYLKDQGICYITLNHSKSNSLSDSNYDDNRPWQGISPFGFKVIEEMNRLGIMIDISHSTDSVVVQALRHSKAPIIASHSCCRNFVPGLERNLPDNLIKDIAGKNGIIMVNFGTFFLDSISSKNWNYIFDVWQDSTGISPFSEEGKEFVLKYSQNHKLFSAAKQVVDHIEHIIKLVGIDYVGIGTDYDGIGIAKPIDLPDVSGFPVLVAELLKRGYSEKDISKILSQNFLRVWEAVLAISTDKV